MAHEIRAAVEGQENKRRFEPALLTVTTLVYFCGGDLSVPGIVTDPKTCTNCKKESVSRRVWIREAWIGFDLSLEERVGDRIENLAENSIPLALSCHAPAGLRSQNASNERNN